MLRKLLLISSLLGLVACSPSAEVKLLDHAEQLLALYPDSAQLVLGQITPEKVTDPALQARYALLTMRADFAVEGVLPSDSLLRLAYQYYEPQTKRKELSNRAHALYFAGKRAQTLDEPDHAMAHFLEAETTLSYADDASLRGDILMDMGRLYRLQRYVHLSSVSFEQAAESYERDGRMPEALAAWMAAGQEYYRFGDLEKAARYWHKSYELAIQLRDTTSLIHLESGMATDAMRSGNHKDAMRILIRATDRYAHGVTPREYYHLLGVLKLHEGDVDSSAYYLAERMVDVAEQQRQEALYGLSLGHWILENEDVAGDFFASMGEYEKAYKRKARALRTLDSIYYAEKHSVLPRVQGLYRRQVLEDQNKVLHHRIIAQCVIAVLLLVSLLFMALWLKTRRRQLILMQRQTISEYRQVIFRLRDAYTAEQAKSRIGLPQDLIDRRLDFVRKLLDAVVLYGNRSETLTKKVNELVSSESEGGVQWVFEDILNMQHCGIVDFLRRSYPTLTDREIALYSMICLDISKSTICMVAGISPKTYYNQRNILRTKLNLTNLDMTFAEHFDSLREACKKSENRAETDRKIGQGN